MSELALSNDGVSSVSGSLQIRTMDDLSRMSSMLAKSGFFSDATDAAQCGVKVLAGLGLGITPFNAMVGIHIIKGKPSVGAGLMASKVKASGKYDYEVLEHTEQVCRIAFYEAEFRGEIKALKRRVLTGEATPDQYAAALEAIALGISEFTAKDAGRVGTQNMSKFPKNMLFARAMSNGVKWYCPDVFESAVYTPEELGAQVNEDGDIIDVSPIAPVETASSHEPRSAPNPRLEWLKSVTGFDGRKVLEAVAKLTDVEVKRGGKFRKDFSDEEIDSIRNAVFVQWALDQDIYTDSASAYQSLYGIDGNEPRLDTDLWTEWKEYKPATPVQAEIVEQMEVA